MTKILEKNTFLKSNQCISLKTNRRICFLLSQKTVLSYSKESIDDYHRSKLRFTNNKSKCDITRNKTHIFTQILDIMRTSAGQKNSLGIDDFAQTISPTEYIFIDYSIRAPCWPRLYARFRQGGEDALAKDPPRHNLVGRIHGIYYPVSYNPGCKTKS